MKLKVGETYDTRDGKVVEVTCQLYGISIYPFVARNGFLYTIDGIQFAGKEGPNDLISVHKPATQEPATESGDLYRAAYTAARFAGAHHGEAESIVSKVLELME